MYFVYILLLANKTLYTGSTADIQKRINDHCNGRVKSTRHKRPVKLLHQEGYILKSDAQRRERFLKTTEGKRLLKQQIRDILTQENYMRS